MKDFIGLLKRGVLLIMTATLLLGTGMAFAASASGDGMRRTADIRYGMTPASVGMSTCPRNLCSRLARHR